MCRVSGATGSIALHPLPLRQGLLLNRELDWLLGSPSNPLVSIPTHPQALEQRFQVSSPLACSANPLTPTGSGSWDSYFDPLSGFDLGKVNFTFRATILHNDLIWRRELSRALGLSSEHTRGSKSRQTCAAWGDCLGKQNYRFNLLCVQRCVRVW